LKELEDHRQYSSLRVRLEDEEWVGLYLDLAEQQFWLDPAVGVQCSLPFMLAAAIYRRDANQDAADVGEFFEKDIKQPYHNWWMWADQSLIYEHSRNPSDEEQTGLVELAKLASQRCPTFPQPLPDCRKELEAVLWWRLGEAYESKDDNKALEWYEKALERLGQETELREVAAKICWNVANKLYEENKYTEGISLLDRVIELKTDYAWAYNSRGFAYWNLGEYEQAIVNYDQAIKLDPKDVLAHGFRGNAYENLGDYERAFADYDRAIELDPEYVYAYYSRGNAFKDLNEFKRAIADFDQAIELDPEYVYAYYSRGEVYSNLKEFEQAIADFDQAIELDPKHALAYGKRGFAYLFLKNTRQASADYTRLWVLAPQNVNALWMAEWVSVGKERPGTEMAERLEEIAAIDPESYEARVCKGVALGLRGKLREGLAELEKAILFEPESWDAYFWKGMLCAYFYPGRNLATEALEKALEVDLPPVLLTPLYWLEKDEPDFFKKYATPLLERYKV
jgi:tetratricopeptide (TPR) repeat protein